jgi:hypothetical protein
MNDTSWVRGMRRANGSSGLAREGQARLRVLNRLSSVCRNQHNHQTPERIFREGGADVCGLKLRDLIELYITGITMSTVVQYVIIPM